MWAVVREAKRTSLPTTPRSDQDIGTVVRSLTVDRMRKSGRAALEHMREGRWPQQVPPSHYINTGREESLTGEGAREYTRGSEVKPPYRLIGEKKNALRSYGG